MKIYAEQFAFEVTQRCNMACAHCLRGEAQNVDISFATIDKALMNVEHIGNIIFTGGEPSLNVPAIRYILEACQARNINVDSFFVATNGKRVGMDFLHVMLDWYAYVQSCCGDMELSSLALSSDVFHEDISPNNIAILKGLSFFSDTEKKNDYHYGVINEGRAAELSSSHWIKREPCHYDNEYVVDDCDIAVSGMIYITADGKVKSDCDTAFNNNEFVIGDLSKDSLDDILVRDSMSVAA